jgi:aryl-alcohol dehydrogenase-like predicted oxidoreductase
MKKRKIGSLEVSVVGVGCNNFGSRIDESGTRDVVDTAIDTGINFFDTADMYGGGRSEELLGKVLGRRRSQVVIATKFANQMPGQGSGARPEYIRVAIDASLRRLGTDYIDLYQQHVPDPDVPIAETLGALNDLVRDGKVREIGCSNFTVAQLREAESASEEKRSARFASVQNEYSLLSREPEDEGVLAECARQGLAFLPYFPLKSGLLTGKYRKGAPIPQNTRVAKNDRYRQLLTEENLEKIEALNAFAESHHHSLLQLAFSWLLAHREVASVIAGASNGDQVRANATAPSWDLSAQDLSQIDELLRVGV